MSALVLVADGHSDSLKNKRTSDKLELTLSNMSEVFLLFSFRFVGDRNCSCGISLNTSCAADDYHKLLRALCFAGRSEYVLDFVSHHILYCLTGRFQILTRIKMIRMFSHILTNRSCHCESDI